MMRREFLKQAVGLGLIMSSGTVLANTKTFETRKPKPNIVVGIGGAGCNFLDILRTMPKFDTSLLRTITVNWNEEQNRRFEKDQGYEQIMLGDRKFAQSAFWNYEATKAALTGNPPLEVDNLLPLLNDRSPLILVAGIGGSTGTILGLHLAKAAMEVRIPVHGIWIQPFSFEINRVRLSEWIADQGIYDWSDCQLPSNANLISILGGQVTMKDAYRYMSTQIAKDILWRTGS